jgi:hypothetical protein
MLNRTMFIGMVVIMLTASVAVAQDNVRYYQENGITYRETRTTVQRTVPETRMQQCTSTVYREQVTTEMRDTPRTWQCPVTEYRWESAVVGRWNPFIEPYRIYRTVPTTRWETHSDVVKAPVVTRCVVPETRTVQMPVTTYRTVPEEIVSRVPVSNPSPPAVLPQYAAPTTAPAVPSGADASMARREEIGGVQRLDRDGARWGR